MSAQTLIPKPLSRADFEPFGDVVEAVEDAERFPINAGTMERYHALATVALQADPADRAIISIARCSKSIALPYAFDLVERHPLGSQAFIPLSREPFLVVVGPTGEAIGVDELRAFITNGRQGINYHCGVWHMPLTAFHQGQEFIIVDRTGAGANCEEKRFDEPITILKP